MQRGFDDLSSLSMLDLFRVEAENQTAILTSGLLELERGNAGPQLLETLMRAAHSLKGAARIVNVQSVVRVAHAMEDCFVATQERKLQLHQSEIDVLLRGVDLLLKISKRPDATASAATEEPEVTQFLASLANVLHPSQDSGEKRKKPEAPSRPTAESKRAKLHHPGGAADAKQAAQTATPVIALEPHAYQPAAAVWPPQVGGGDGLPTALARKKPATADAPAQAVTLRQEEPERVVRLTADSLNRLLGLAGESLVESRWLRPFAESLQRLKRQHTDLSQRLDRLRQSLQQDHLSDQAESQLHELTRSVAECHQFLTARMEELDVFDRRSAHLSHRLYLEVLRTRMRPFADGARRFPRMVRDLARALGKDVRLEVIGENTQVDRDILERLETPLAHLLRNAVDHGCESPQARRAAGKPEESVVRLEARHSAGMLVVTVSDDGTGVDPERVRKVIIQKKLAMASMAEKLSESELLEFLFLPGFTLKDTVTEISGRGVGLDIVQNMVKSVRGAIRIYTQPERGMRMQLHLPLTLSVLRALLVEVAGEPYAIPLTQISRALKLPREKIEMLEGRHYFHFGDQHVGLLTAHQVLDCGDPVTNAGDLPIVVLGDRNARYGLIVDRFLGERELVVQPLDPRLGKIKDISAAALMEDGSPVLIVDVEDLVRSIEKLASGGALAKVQRGLLDGNSRKQKRILAVDDSLTVRELERKLLSGRGYVTDVAVDGMDGWNAVRNGKYDLVVTDVDMPRMDGIELATLIKKDPELRSIPVMIVSYKDREEDKMRGLEAGADYYLTKGSFHDETLLQAVVDLIGEPET
jgi:two-component system, chemotaxis family, sensor histidine kinase and response regulator WspE